MTFGILEKWRQKETMHKAKAFFEQRLDFLIGPMELHRMIERGENINIIDVRHLEDYETDHIPGAINLPEDAWSTCRGLRKDRPNIVYCYTMVCQLATRAARYFAEHDFPVIELQGGIEQWKKCNLPVEHFERATV
jgi:rhodanese-related sulfurtransferase